MELEHLTREELLELLHQLLVNAEQKRREQQENSGEQVRLVHELRVHQVELEMQNRELRETQLAYEKSRDRYAKLYDDAPIAYITLDQSYRIEGINHKGAALFGGSRPSLLGRSFLELAGPSGKLRFIDLLARSRATYGTESAELELELSGAPRAVQVIVTASGDDQPEYRCALLDISERKHAERERDRALAAEQALHQRFESLDHIGFAINNILATEERTSTEALLGRVAEQALVLLGAERVTIRVLPASTNHASLEISRAAPLSASTERPTHELSVPLRLFRRQLGEISIRYDARSAASTLDLGRTLELLAARVSLALEIARVNKLEAKERARLGLLDQASRELVCSDIEDTYAALTRVGAATIPTLARCCAVYLFEHGHAKLLGAEHERPRGQRTLAKLAARLGALLGNMAVPAGEPAYEAKTVTVPVRALDGSGRMARLLEIECVIAVPLEARQRVLGAMCFGCAKDTDSEPEEATHALSELAGRCAVALDLANLLDELRTAVESRDTLLAIVSHDLRSPLNAISITARALAPAPPRTERRRSGQQVELIQRSVDRMSHLVEDLLAASNIDSGEFTVEPTAEPALDLLREAHGMSQPLAHGKQIALALGDGAELPPVSADRYRILQVFSNLIGNAVRFTPSGGTVTLTAERCERVVRFGVLDSGPGIPPHQIGRIFDRYWTGRAQRTTGLGLGLYIAQRIVLAHGGRIWVESAPGAGASFYFTLPMAAERPSGLRRPPGSPPEHVEQQQPRARTENLDQPSSLLDGPKTRPRLYPS